MTETTCASERDHDYQPTGTTGLTDGITNAEVKCSLCGKVRVFVGKMNENEPLVDFIERTSRESLKQRDSES